jgi:hypothetical protein
MGLKGEHNKRNARAVLDYQQTLSRMGLKGEHNKRNARAVLDYQLTRSKMDIKQKQLKTCRAKLI